MRSLLMIDIPVEDLLKITGSVYKLVILAARRTVELNNGAKSEIDDPSIKKMSTIALYEIAEGKIKYKIKK